MKEIIQSDKKYGLAVILSGFFGIIGVQHFYMRRYAMGFFDLGMFLVACTLYGLEYYLIAGIVFIIDLIHTVFVTYKLLVGEFKDGEGKVIMYPGQKN